MTPTYRVRLSPSGKFIGSIGAPLQQGPGSTGLQWRKHGAGAQTVVTTATAVVTGLDAMPVILKPGYLYDIELDYVVQAAGLTSTTNYSSYYRLYNAATSAWGNWVPMINGAHALHDNTALTGNEAFVGDAVFDVSTTVTCTQIGFGIVSDAGAGFFVLPLASFARVAEYMP